VKHRKGGIGFEKKLCAMRFASGKEVKNDEEENVCLDVGGYVHSFNS
jgi:hypothetical protein